MTLDELQEDLDLRANSLIVTVFGDTLLPLGGGAWLSGLITLMSEFGLSERLVRTGVYRLQKDGILQSKSVGRRAFYELSDLGRLTFETAETRIYNVAPQDWNGEWQLVYLLPGLTNKTRQKVKKELRWQSFGEFGTNLLARPSNQPFDRSLLQEAHLEGFVISFQGQLHDSFPKNRLAELAKENWDLENLNEEYMAFVDRFTRAANLISENKKPSDQVCFRLRTLLTHDYRRLLLRDPQLPNDLLPESWAGQQASNLAARIYQMIGAQAQKHALEILERTENEMEEDFWERFGGLEHRGQI